MMKKSCLHFFEKSWKFGNLVVKFLVNLAIMYIVRAKHSELFNNII